MKNFIFNFDSLDGYLKVDSKGPGETLNDGYLKIEGKNFDDGIDGYLKIGKGATEAVEWTYEDAPDQVEWTYQPSDTDFF